MVSRVVEDVSIWHVSEFRGCSVVEARLERSVEDSSRARSEGCAAVLCKC